MEHFGLKLVKKKYSLHLKREEFALINTKPSLPVFNSLIEKNAYKDATYQEYSQEWCEKYRELCLKNFDLNIEYYNKLNTDDFLKSLDSFFKKYSKFVKIDDLNNYSETSGYYIMVLDKYKQIYIGKSLDIKKRIKQHWSTTKRFDRTLFPMYNVKSCFSIDFFRALDTTRIYVWKREVENGVEAELISNFPKDYCTNRIGGDIVNGMEAIATLNEHAFID